ncbi:MAG: cytidylate kinase-like family protein [Lachnospiraceae bacterium]|nr:cytidylate kinase-like family protein [Lachnospiraceae bacterium]
MTSQLIISVGREFGSGGHEIAKDLAEHYQIELLDSNLLTEVAKHKELELHHLEGLEEKRKIKLFSRTVRGFSSSPEENLALLQFDYLQKKAAEGNSFVVVGRCSENILRKFKCLISIFVLADRKCKMERVMKLYEMSESMAEKYIRERDMERKRYHNSFCEGKWGDSRNYDLSVNSSKLGLDETTEMLIEYIDRRRKK